MQNKTAKSIDKAVDFSGKKIDSSKTNTAKTDTGSVKHQDTWIEHFVKDPIINNNWVLWAVGGILVVVFSSLRKYLHKKFSVFFKQSVIYVDFSKRDYQEAIKHYVPNNFRINDEFDKPLLLSEEDTSDLKQFLLKGLDYSINFIVAPTGVGKTTFTLNLTRGYDKFFKRHKRPKLYVCRANSFRSWELINEMSTSDARRSIIILDGLDEYYASNRDAADPQKYWEDFWKDWTPLMQKLKHFGKAIITVREQFLTTEQLSKLHFSDRTAERGFTVHLDVFDDATRNQYLEKRFSNLTPTDLTMLKDFAEELDNKGQEMIGQPLILNYLDDLWAENKRQVEQRGGNFSFDTYHVYFTIIDYWLNREVKTKRVNNPNFKAELRMFCENLAYRIAEKGQTNSLTLTDLQKFEKSNEILPIFEGFGDRALLEKYKSGDKEYFRFTHVSFMQFFLVLCAEHRPEQEKKINFINHQFALHTLIGKRWRALNHRALRYVRPAPVGETPELPVELLQAWDEAVNALTTNEGVKKVFADNLSDLHLTKVIVSEDPDAVSIFMSFEGSCMTNNSINHNERLIKPALSAVKYLKDFLEEIDFYNAGLRDADLDVLKDIRNLKRLSLINCFLSGSGLENFNKTTQLETLNIYNNSINDKALRHFVGNKGLKELDVRANQITGPGLAQFKASCPTLHTLLLAHNPIIDTDTVYKTFKSCAGLKKIDFSMLENADHLLPLCENSVRTLNEIYICGTKVKDKDLRIFKDLVTLDDLDICRNNLKGECLSYFPQIYPQLYKFSVEYNEFDDEVLSPLKEARNLSYLNISGNPVTDNVWENFKRSQEKIEKLIFFETAAKGPKTIAFINGCTNLKMVKIDHDFYLENLNTFTELSDKGVEVKFKDSVN